MTPIAPDLLAAVTGGGESSTSASGPLVSYQSTRSDYAKCVDTVKQESAQQYPSTKFLGLFGTDRNAGPRAQATMDNMRNTCGLPPH